MTAPIIAGGRFTSAGAAQNILLPGGADYMRVVNLTQSATTQATGRGVIFEWWADYTPVDGALEWKKTNSTDALNLVSVSSGGFTYVDGVPPVAAPFSGSVITAATPAVATATNTLTAGDRIRIYGNADMKQISGMAFTVSSVTSGGFTLLGLPAAGFADPESAFTAQKILPTELVLPQYLFVTAISKASQAVITISTVHDYAVGMKVRMDIPSSYGMQEMNGLEAAIVAVGSYSITIDVDSSGFSTFAFPSSSDSPALPRFATLAPAGQKAYYDLNTQTQYGYNVDQAPFRSAFPTPYIVLAAGVQSPAGSTSDIIEWQAFRYSN